MKKQKSIFNHKPEALIFSSFFLAALIGAILLRLPVSCAKIPLSGIDALFMSVSAVCVTGLSVADIGKDLTLFGQLVILVLIQLGGLGIMTFSLLFLIAIGKKMPLYSKLCVPDLSQDVSFRNIKYSVFLIFAMALLIESAGAVLLFFDFRNHYTFPFAVYSSIFHSVSAYCNAGFSLYPDNLIGFNNNPYVMSILMYLIVLGGLGFVVIHEVSRVVFNKMRNDKKSRINLHSKIALTGSAGFVIMGAVIIWLLEKQGIMRDMPLSHQIFNSFFLSVTSRTAGFNTLEMSRLTNPTLFLLLSFMFIGGCPGSTAGGIKIHTFFSVVAHIRSKFWGLKMTNLFNRKIPEAVIDRALTIFIASAVIVFISVFLLQLTENISIAHFAINKKTEFMDTIFEAISAFGTVGLSTGTTPFLSFWGKFIIICLMFIGRVGPLTLGIALQLKQRQKIIYEFPNEEIMIS